MRITVYQKGPSDYQAVDNTTGLGGLGNTPEAAIESIERKWGKSFTRPLSFELINAAYKPLKQKGKGNKQNKKHS